MSNFAYMSGTGNDFLVGEYDGPVSEIQIIALVSDSEFEIDGVIFVEKLDKSNVKMHYFNNDGSQAELCVNGVRCVAKYSVDNQFVAGDEFVVNAPVSDIKVKVMENIVELNAPIPEFNENYIEIANHKGILSTVGNPHFMIEVNDVENFNLEDLYKIIKDNKHFKFGVNLEIYEIINDQYIKARVYERGVGETDACGSGALCMFNYLSKTNKISAKGYVIYPGGELYIRFENNDLYLSGEVIYL